MHGPYTKDTYLNPLLVNTYALGYYYNMYVGGVPLLRQGGAMVIVNPMPYRWTAPTHDAYRAIFEEAVGPLGPDRFEELQERFATDETFNDIYRNGLGPAAVHGFYMYTWAAHGMEKVGKVFVVGAEDDRGPSALGWEKCDSVTEAVAAARAWLGDPDAETTFWQCPPVGYARVSVEDERERARIAAAAECPKGKAKQLKAEKAAVKEAGDGRIAAEENAKRAMPARAEEAKRMLEEEKAKKTRSSDETVEKLRKRERTAEKRGMNAPDAAKAQAERATAGALANARFAAPRGLATRREERDMWLGAVTVPPPHLNGSMPGDQGFDPLGLGVDPRRLAWYQEAELAHGRWAMAAVVGVVAAEAAGAAPWWSAGAASYALPANALLAIQFAAMGVLELETSSRFPRNGRVRFLVLLPVRPARLAFGREPRRRGETRTARHARDGGNRRAGRGVPRGAAGGAPRPRRGPVRVQSRVERRAHRPNLRSHRVQDVT